MNGMRAFFDRFFTGGGCFHCLSVLQVSCKRHFESGYLYNLLIDLHIYLNKKCLIGAALQDTLQDTYKTLETLCVLGIAKLLVYSNLRECLIVLQKYGCKILCLRCLQKQDNKTLVGNPYV